MNKKEIKIACGKKIRASFDSEHPEHGGSIMICGDGITCVDCTKWNDANCVEDEA